MTKYAGVLTPPQSTVKGCEQCVQIKKQAEDAFTELRAQTDRHIAAVQKKLREEHAVEIARVKAANDIMTAEIRRFKELLARAENDKRLERQEAEVEAKLESIRAECDARIDEVEQLMRKEEAVACKQREDLIRTHKRELITLQADLEESNGCNAQQTSRIDELELDVQSLKAQVAKSKLEHQIQLDRQTRQVALERDELKEQLGLAHQRLGSLDNWKTEADLERAKLDLAYRKRIGEMESEVRRTEIESVRLRREIIQLNQKLESQHGTNFLMLRSSARPKQLSLEGFRESRANNLPLSSGRIARVCAAESPRRSAGDVEELPPPFTPPASSSN